MQQRSRYQTARRILIFWTLFIGIGAVGGALMMLLDPSGKAVGMDSDKNTFVRLYGVEECEKRVEKYTNLAIERLNAFEDSGYMRALALSLTQRRS